jgi:hypothetical protein
MRRDHRPIQDKPLASSTTHSQLFAQSITATGGKGTLDSAEINRLMMGA